MAYRAHTPIFLGIIEALTPRTKPGEGTFLATRFVPGGAHRRCVKRILGSRRDEVWRAGERDCLSVGCELSLIARVGIFSRGNSRENRLSQFESKSIFFFLYMPARQYIRIMPKWGLITRLGSKVMSIAVNSFLLVPDLHDSHAFFRFLVFLFCSLNY